MLMLLLFVVISVVLLAIKDVMYVQERWVGCSVFMSFVIIITLFIGLGNYSSTYYLPEKREAIILTMDEFMNEDDIFTDAFDAEIIEFNTSLASYKKQNSNPWFNLGVSDVVDEVQPITRK